MESRYAAASLAVGVLISALIVAVALLVFLRFCLPSYFQRSQQYISLPWSTTYAYWILVTWTWLNSHGLPISRFASGSLSLVISQASEDEENEFRHPSEQDSTLLYPGEV